MTEEAKRQQAIKENNTLRKQNNELRAKNEILQKEIRDANGRAGAALSRGSKIKEAALAVLHSNHLERLFANGGINNVRECIKVAMGFDGLSQAEIDTAF